MVVLAFPLCNDTRKPRLLQSRRKHNLFAWHISTLTALFALLTQGFASLITQKNILDTSIDDLKVKLAFRMQADGIMEECLGSPINLEHSEDRWNIFEPMKSNEKDKKEIEPKDTLDAPSKNMDPREDIITNAIHKAFNKCHLQESEVHGNKGISEFRKEIIKTWNQFDNFLEKNSIINPVVKKSEKNQHQTSENNLKAKKDTSWLSLIVNIFEKINFVDEIGSAKNNKIEFILNDIVVLFVSLIEKFHLVDRKELGDFLNSEQGQDLIFNYSVGRFLTQNPSSAARLYINYDYENTLKNSLYTQEIHGILGEMNHDSFRYITWILIETEINFQKDKINFFYLEQFQTDLNVIVKRDYNRLRNKSVNEKKIQLFMEDMMERIYQLQIHPTEFTHREQTIASLLHKMLYFILKYYVESKEVDIISKLKKSKYFPFILEFDNAMWNMSKSLKSILSKHQELKQLIMLHPEPENIIDLNFYKIKLLADMSNGIKKTLLSEKYEKYYSFKFNAIENGEEKIGEIIKALSLSWKLRNKMIIHQLSENKIDYNNKYPISSFIEKINYQSVLISECWRQDLNSMNKFQENFSWSSVKQFLGIFRDIFRDIFQKPRGFN